MKIKLLILHIRVQYVKNLFQNSMETFELKFKTSFTVLVLTYL